VYEDGAYIYKKKKKKMANFVALQARCNVYRKRWLLYCIIEESIVEFVGKCGLSHLLPRFAGMYAIIFLSLYTEFLY